MESRLRDRTLWLVRLNGEDVTDDIWLVSGRGASGWSQYELVHRQRGGMAEVDVPIGWLEHGYCYFKFGGVSGYTAEDRPVSTDAQRPGT